MPCRILNLEDTEKLEQFLATHLYSSVHLLDKFGTGLYAGYFQGSNLLGVAACFDNAHIFIQSPEGGCHLIAFLMAESGKPIRGILGPFDQVSEIINKAGLESDLFQLRKTNSLYHIEIEKLILPSKLTGNQLTARPLERHDLPTYIQWKTDYNISVMRACKTPTLKQLIEKEATLDLKNQHVWLLEKGGELLSACTIAASTHNIMQLGLVWTPINNRSRDYARSIIAACLFNAWSSPIKHCVLYAFNDNIPLKKVCESIGFETVGEYSHIIFKQALGLKNFN